MINSTEQKEVYEHLSFYRDSTYVNAPYFPKLPLLLSPPNHIQHPRKASQSTDCTPSSKHRSSQHSGPFFIYMKKDFRIWLTYRKTPIDLSHKGHTEITELCFIMLYTLAEVE